MSVSAKTFTPDGTWTYTGDVTLVSGEAKLTANLVHDIDNGGATVDLSLLNDGDPIAGLTDVAVTTTKETVSGTPVISVSAATWGGFYVTGSSLDNGAVKVKIRSGGRWNPFMRWTSGVQSGYLMQTLLTQSAISGKLGVALVSFFDGARNAALMFTPGASAPSAGSTVTLNTYTEADGDVTEIGFIDGQKLLQIKEAERKWAAGLYGMQLLAATVIDYFKVYQMATGTAETPVLTPNEVTTWGQITLDIENLAEVMGTCMLSDILQYKMSGGTPNPAVYTAVPDDGDISASTGNAIQLKLTIDNRYAAQIAAFLHALGVNLGDGTWDAAGAVPTVPTSVAVRSLDPDRQEVTWVDSNGAVYFIYRNTVNDFPTATLVGCVEPGVQKFIETGLTAVTEFFYFVVASDAS